MMASRKRRDLEERILEVSRILRASAVTPPLLDTGKWLGRLMAWAMRSESFRTNLLRFIDVLPSLSSDALVAQTLREYFGDRGDAPLLIRQGVRRIAASFPEVSGRLIRNGAERIGRHFIAGKGPADAVAALHGLWTEGAAHSVDLLGEAVLSDKEAAEYVRRYVELIRVLGTEASGWRADPLLERDDRGSLPRLSISLKISSFDSQLDPVDWDGSIRRVKEGVRPVIGEAVRAGASVCFDMEHHHLKGLTLSAFKAVLEEFPEYHHAGIALQAYLRDSAKDLRDLMDWARQRKRPVTIRLVKGAYWDYETVVNRQRGWPVPVFLDKAGTDRNFEELTEVLLSGGPFVRPAVATHNMRSIANAIAISGQRGLSKESFEFQMLYGMAGPFLNTLRQMGYRVRVYSPVGELIPGMAYLVRRLLENTSNESFFRKFFAERAALDDLLKPPAPGRKRYSAGPSVEGFRNEPLLDFSLEENRRRMQDSLREVKGGFSIRHPLIIAGEEFVTPAEIRSVNPADTREVVGIVSAATSKEADLAVASARSAWNAWKKTPPDTRAGYLFAAAGEMRKERFDLAALEVYEVGKTWKDADGDVAEAIDYLEYYGMQMKRLAAPPYLGDYPGEQNEYGYVPRGIGVVISPWNFPLAIATGMVSASLVTGNCVIFKPSGLSPVIGAHLCRIFGRAGLPPGVLQFLPGPGGEVGAHLAAHPGVDFIAFTGSKEVGLRIVQLAGETRPGQRNVKKVIAEMGGKNAVIVDETADLDEAVRGVLESSLGFQGQKCSACSRVIIVGDAFDPFCSRLTDAMESIRIGPPERPDTFMGPVIDDNALKKIRGYIEQGSREATVLLSREASMAGHFIGPAIFTGLHEGSSLLQEEIFGPVLSVLRAGDMDEAIRIANSVPYALTGGIFSRSPGSIRKAREDFRAGNLYINRKITGALVGRQPFGGFGMSGVGTKAGGPDYLLHFMHPRSVSENTLRRGFAPDARPHRNGPK